MNLKHQIVIALILINILNFLDIIVTFFGVSKYGLIAEGNPFIIFMLKNYGWIITGILKVVFILIISFIPIKVVDNLSDNPYSKYLKIAVLFVMYALCWCYVVIIYEWLMVLV